MADKAPKTAIVSANAGTREMFAALFANHEKAKRELMIAWTAWLHMNDEPLTTQLVAVAPDGLVIQRDG